MASAPPLPAGLPLDTADWEQTPPVVRQVVLRLLEVIQQQHTTIQHLDARLQTLEARIAALEAGVQQRANHSDRPPSSDPPYAKRPARADPQRQPGAKPGHPGHRQAWLAPTEVIEVTPKPCACGQIECPDTPPDDTHQVIALPEMQMIVRHCVWHEARCAPCGRRSKAHVPLEACTGDGPRLTALSGEWSGPQRGSRSAVQACCASVLGGPISQGAIQRCGDRVSEAIPPHDEAMAGKARRTTVNSIDETAWYQHGVLAWLWVMVNTPVALFKVQARRSQAAFEALMERWAGILVSDGDGVYGPWVHARQTCLAHLIRRARGLSEHQDPALAPLGRRVLAEWQRWVHWAQAPPTAGAIQTW